MASFFNATIPNSKKSQIIPKPVSQPQSPGPPFSLHLSLHCATEMLHAFHNITAAIVSREPIWPQTGSSKEQTLEAGKSWDSGLEVEALGKQEKDRKSSKGHWAL